MSDELRTIPAPDTSEDRGSAREVHLGSFWGGDERGKSIQLTVGDRFVQFTERGFRSFIRDCERAHRKAYGRKP